MIRIKAQSQEGNWRGQSIRNLPYLHGKQPRSTQGWDLELIQACRKPKGQRQRTWELKILHLSRESLKFWTFLNCLGHFQKQDKHQGSRKLIVYLETARWKAPRSLGTHSPKWRMSPRPSYHSQMNLSSTRMLTWSSQSERSLRKYNPRNLRI